jgi:chromosome segregation ATPase
MKNVALVIMALLLIGGAYFLKTKSEQVSSLSERLSARDSSLHELESRMKEIDSRAKQDEATLAEDQKKLSAGQMTSAQLTQDLAAAQQALALELARKKAFQDQLSVLASAARDGSDPSLAGPLQNDQLRLAEVNRQLKAIEEFVKNRKSKNTLDAKTYHAQMKAQEAASRNQIKDQKSRIKELQKQLSLKRKEKFNVERTTQVATLQQSIDRETASLASMEESLRQLNVKESADTQSNNYEQQQAGTYDGDQRVALLKERSQLESDLSNLKSRAGLVKRDTSEINSKMNALRSQERDSDSKIQALNQTVARLKAELGQTAK